MQTYSSEISPQADVSKQEHKIPAPHPEPLLQLLCGKRVNAKDDKDAL